jgi:hypothetical protein
MKTFELDEMGVQEMDAEEIMETDGGMLGLLTLPLAGWISGYLYIKLTN